MPWKTCDRMESKEAFVSDYLRGDLSVAELCRRHGISRKCGYKWIGRYKRDGDGGLGDRSRAPLTSATRSSREVEEQVVRIRSEHPAWGGRKIRKILENEGFPGALPSASTVSNILRRHGMLGPGTRNGAQPWRRFERGEPNDLWQMDFKGWISVGHDRRCYPLTLLDDHSRYNIVLQACSGETEEEVRPHLVAAFRRYGLPRQILCDRGNPWGGKMGGRESKVRGTSALEVWLMRLGVEIIHGRLRHPQTQGKEERFHRTLKAEVLMRESHWRDLPHCQQAFDAWREIYNDKRPHEALGMLTPSRRYSLSHRPYPEKLPEEGGFYLEGDHLRRVKSKGEITFGNRFFYIGSAYAGGTVALRPGASGVWEVFFCWKRLGRIDMNEKAMTKGRYHSIRED